MNLVIDIGNSYVKIGCFNKGRLADPVRTIETSDLNQNVEDINPEKIIVSTVAGELDGDTLRFISRFPTLLVDHTTPLPFKLDYNTPETLGVDRIAAVAGAQVINPGSVSMVIDAGTCITYDLLEKGTFRGGAISPGIKLRFKSMHDYTSNLPLIDKDNSFKEQTIVGKSTYEAMKSGVLNGIKGEMESFIDGYMELFPDLKVIMCGGEAKFFESRLKASIFVVPELVLIGLNRILEYNE